MHYIACIHRHDFYWPRALKCAGLPDDASVAVHHNQEILDASPAAIRIGLHLRQSLGEAKNLAGNRCQFIAWKEEDYAEEQNAWLDRLLEFVDTVEPLAQHRALVDLSLHPQPHVVADLLKQSLTSYGYKINFGGASCRWLAELACDEGDAAGDAWLTPRAYIRQFPLGKILAIPTEVRQSLKRLGYHLVADLETIPDKTLQRQFGKQAFTIRQCLHGIGPATVQNLYPPQTSASRVFSQAPIDNEIALHALIHQLSQVIGKDLHQRQLAGKKVILKFIDEEQRAETRQRSFTKPILDPQTLHSSLSLLVQAVPIHPPVEVRVRLPELARYRPEQASFAIKDPVTQGQRALSAIEKVQGVFGESAIKAATIQSGRQAFLNAYKHVAGWN